MPNVKLSLAGVAARARRRTATTLLRMITVALQSINVA